jgi:hypothetical protein
LRRIIFIRGFPELVPEHGHRDEEFTVGNEVPEQLPVTLPVVRRPR